VKQRARRDRRSRAELRDAEAFRVDQFSVFDDADCHSGQTTFADRFVDLWFEFRLQARDVRVRGRGLAIQRRKYANEQREQD
jgi:hypothetical protein